MAILLFKLVQVQHAYTFSPASSVALTQLLKLALAACLHARYMRSEPGRTWAQGISCRIIIHCVGLATVYMVNNQLTFAILAIVDPGTFSLGKSVSPYLVAIILRTLGQQLNSLLWIYIFVQCCAIAITQYDKCTSKAFLSSKAYLLMVASAFVTASTSVWNQKVLQGCDVPVGNPWPVAAPTRSSRRRPNCGFTSGRVAPSPTDPVPPPTPALLRPPSLNPYPNGLSNTCHVRSMAPLRAPRAWIPFARTSARPRLSANLTPRCLWPLGWHDGLLGISRDGAGRRRSHMARAIGMPAAVPVAHVVCTYLSWCRIVIVM